MYGTLGHQTVVQFVHLLRFYQAVLKITLSINPLANLEPPDKRYCYKTDENNYVPTKKPKA